jgi:SAM-dependent methyltransferase
MDNKNLRQKYEQMHNRGSSAWFDDGELERTAILKSVRWKNKTVLEIGCGEGDLLSLIAKSGPGLCYGIDYSETAIATAQKKHPELSLWAGDYKNFGILRCDILVMQGVLEHLDDPFAELKEMIDKFQARAVVTSSPSFINPRGIVWMTLDMLGAVMSKTDLHYLFPWQFQRFCDNNNYSLEMVSIDNSWGYGIKMINDLRQRIPLALKDGNIKYDNGKLVEFLNKLIHISIQVPRSDNTGATMIYKIGVR